MQELREKYYPALDPRTVIIVAEKFKEMPEKGVFRGGKQVRKPASVTFGLRGF